MFIEKIDLANVIYGYQIDQITADNDDLVLQACSAAEQEARSYLTQNKNVLENADGRFIYDIENIFNKTGADRNAIILQHCITMAKYHLISICSAEVIYEQSKDRYDRAIEWFKKLAKGEVVLDSLPIKPYDDTSTVEPFVSGSNPKFNHYF